MNANKVVEFVRDLYSTNELVPLHAPAFQSNESKYVLETIQSTFVSSVGAFVDQFENRLEVYTGSKKAVATVNGTAALHASLYLAGVSTGDLVITQALTFVATCNALKYLGAEPIFVDVSMKSLGLCPVAVDTYLQEHAELVEERCVHKQTKQAIKAVIPMHTFGHPVELDELIEVCRKWKLVLIEDAAESLGSLYKGKHTGTFGRFSAISFNGNKIITTGGGGAILCASESFGNRAKHVTTTAKVDNPYEYQHDELGFNYRLPNINAALGCAQLEVIDDYIKSKRLIASEYASFFSNSKYEFVMEPDYARSNYWLNAILCSNSEERDNFLKDTNQQGIMTRPVWKLMHRLPMYDSALRDELSNSLEIESRLINLPSSPIVKQND